MNYITTSATKIIDYILNSYSKYQDFLDNPCKSYFLENIISTLIGAIIGSSVLFFVILCFSSERSNIRLKILKSVLYGGTFGLLFLIAMVIPCLFGSDIELAGDIAVGFFLIVFFWAWMSSELQPIEVYILLSFFILLFCSLIILKQYL